MEDFQIAKFISTRKFNMGKYVKEFNGRGKNKEHFAHKTLCTFLGGKKHILQHWQTNQLLGDPK
jgi:hypothetical protein